MSLVFKSHKIGLEARVKRCDDYMDADLGGEMAILNTKTGIYFGLNEVGSLVWSLLKEPQTVSSIRDCILREYEVETTRCEQDLLALMTQLVQHELVEVIHAPDS